jgi:PAS domain S-box-containing protein
MSISAVCLMLLLIWQSLIAQELLKYSEDFQFSAEITSTDNFYDETQQEFTGDQYSVSKYKYTSSSSDKNNLIVHNQFQVNTLTGEEVASIGRDYGINRYTGEHVAGLGDKDRDGYLFAPRNLKPGEGFTYWHINYDGPAVMQYIGSVEINNLQLFHYESEYEGVKIDQTDSLTHLPEVGVTRGVELEPHIEVWIEPLTGQLVKYKDETIAYFYDLETGERQAAWNKFTNVFSENSTQKIIASVQTNKIFFQLINWYVPALLLLLFFFFSTLGLMDWRCRKNFKIPNFTIYGISLINIFIPAITLAGWIFTREDWIAMFSSGSGMNPLTALSFILLALISLLHVKQNKRLVFALSIILFCIGLSKFLTFVGVLAVDTDLIIFHDSILNRTVPSRMSYLTSFGLMQLSLMFLSHQKMKLRRIFLPQIIGASLGVLSFLAVIANLFQVSLILDTTLFYSVSSSTAVILFINSLLSINFFTKKNNNFKRSFSEHAAIGILCFMTLFSVGIAVFVDGKIVSQSEKDFQNTTNNVVTLFIDRMEIYLNSLEGARGLIAASDQVSREEWRIYIDTLELQENYPGMQGVGYTVFVEPENLEAHIESIQAEGYPEFSIRPDGERELYSSIIYLEPFDIRNQQAFGYDMYSNELRRHAMEMARDTGLERLSSKITLVQETDEDVQPGFLLYIPVYNKGVDLSTVELRREHIKGYVYSAFRARDFIDGVLGEGVDGISLSLHDGVGAKDPELLLYSSLTEENVKFVHQKTVYLAGQPWTFHFESEGYFGIAEYSKLIPLGIIFMGIIISFMTSTIFYSFISAKTRALEFADKATAKLRARTRELEKTNAKDEAILAAIGEGLMVTDTKQNIIFVNRTFEEITGWKQAEVLDKKTYDILPLLDKNDKLVSLKSRLTVKAINDRKVQNNKANEHYKYKRKNGEVFPISMTVSPIIVNDKILGSVEVFRDISHESEVDSAKTEFVSLVSHQLRTPLSAINWYSEMLLAGDAGKITKKQTTFLEDIRSSNARMITLVNSLLNVSRLELGKLMIEPVKADLSPLVKKVVDEQKISLKKKKMAIKSSIPKQLISKVDPKLFQILVQNLLSNAIKYSPESHPIELTLRKNKEKKTIELIVKDHGYGIPKADQKKIFTKLFRAGNATSLDTEGNGLGLYLVQSIVERAGGKISFKSIEKKGTTFIVSFPSKGMKASKV